MNNLVTAIIVFYKQTPEQSESFTTLREILQARPALAAQVNLLVYDNSPEPQTMPAFPAPLEYLHNPANPGIAAAYNLALSRALDHGSTWLLLLDQDTLLTAEYVEEAFRTLSNVADDVTVIVPQLVQDGHVHSPQLWPRLSHRELPADFHGVAKTLITAFNSGALERVSALKTIGGFPPEFPLDFLDHATFYRLAKAGGKFHVLRAQLFHDLSSATLGGDASLNRFKRILSSELMFHRQIGGTPLIWQRLRRFKMAAGHLLKVSDKRFAWNDLRTAFGLSPKQER